MPTSQAESSPESLSPAIRELLSIFEGELAKVQFPNVSAKILTDLASQVSDESERVEALRQQLDAAQATLAEAQQKLVRTAELGLAYARVYAADDASLLQRLADLQVGPNDNGAPRRRKLEVADPEGAVRLPAKRGRKPKNATPEADVDATGS
ncbi:MAG: hypothetical protein JNK56_01060 [Myxococcales bacterium]|nr:hypothetical protein [Myxococcales bacterium]